MDKHLSPVSWFWIMLAVVAIASAVGVAYSNKYQNQTIQACINNHKQPVIVDNRLQECN